MLEPGVVDQDVHRELERVESRAVGEIHDPRLAPELLGRPSGSELVAIGHDHRGARRGQSAGAGQADPARGSGDQGATPGEVEAGSAVVGVHGGA
jgi:hypothetical protein